jgi:hypothetical protein
MTRLLLFKSSLIGIGEIALLPLDVLKIKKQTNPESIANKSLTQIIREEGLGLYRGAGWTAARNAPGSFALFGGASLVKDRVFKIEDYSKATFFQNFCASIGGAVASITVSAPVSFEFIFYTFDNKTVISNLALNIQHHHSWMSSKHVFNPVPLPPPKVGSPLFRK